MEVSTGHDCCSAPKPTDKLGVDPICLFYAAAEFGNSLGLLYFTAWLHMVSMFQPSKSCNAYSMLTET